MNYSSDERVMPMLRLFGRPNTKDVSEFQKAVFHSGNIYMALMDEAAIWDATVLDDMVLEFPKGHIPESDLFLALTECVANAALHGRAEAFGVYARRRGGILLISFFQLPPMIDKLVFILALAKNRNFPECAGESDGGLGFPILLKLVHRITLSSDRMKLQLWFRVKNA